MMMIGRMLAVHAGHANTPSYQSGGLASLRHRRHPCEYEASAVRHWCQDGTMSQVLNFLSGAHWKIVGNALEDCGFGIVG